MPPTKNEAIHSHFVISQENGKAVSIASCKHCDWQKAFNSTRMKQHLDRCANYQLTQANSRARLSADNMNKATVGWALPVLV